MSRRSQKVDLVIDEDRLNSFMMVSEILNKNWPGVTGMIGQERDGTWTAVVRPGHIERLGKTREEIEAYTTAHKYTHAELMKEFEETLLREMGGLDVFNGN